jgi:hypothetical protein
MRDTSGGGDRKGHLLLRWLTILVIVAANFAAAGSASAHRSGCHRWHTCPSDHATYRWRGLLCVAPYASERNSTFRKRVVYDGRVYYCKH